MIPWAIGKGGDMLFEIQEATSERNGLSLIEYLVKDRFKGKTLVTASLRARSVSVLHMVAQIDPSTPIVFCHAGTLFPESREYKDFIIERLGLTDIRLPQPREAETARGDYDHVEWMKAFYDGTQNLCETSRASQPNARRVRLLDQCCLPPDRRQSAFQSRRY